MPTLPNVIETRRLTLRPWNEGDAAKLYRYAKDPEVGPAAGWPAHTSAEESRQIIRDVLSTRGTYAIVPKETGFPVGSIGVMSPRMHHADVQSGDRELGFWIGKPYWGRGIIPEAVDALLGQCFAAPACHAVWCGYYEGNEKSRRCQEKCGFAFHHVEPNSPVELLDEVRTEVFMRQTREQWLARRGQRG